MEKRQEIQKPSWTYGSAAWDGNGIFPDVHGRALNMQLHVQACC